MALTQEFSIIISISHFLLVQETYDSEEFVSLRSCILGMKLQW